MKSDKTLLQNVLDELRYEPSLDEREIGVNASNGLVALTGRVKSYAEKMAALHAVERVVGVEAVANEILVEPTVQFERTDVDIAEAALQAVHWLASVPPGSIRVQVENGWVTLDGKVSWRYQSENAENAILPLAGVRGVINQVVIESPVSSSEVTQQIAAALARRAALHARDIHVVTENRRVVLKGKVNSWNERREAENAAWAAPGVTWVENHLVVAN